MESRGTHRNCSLPYLSMVQRSRMFILVMSVALSLGAIGLFSFSLQVSNAEANLFEDLADNLSTVWEEDAIRKSPVNPFEGKTLFVGMDTNASRTAKQWEKGNPKDAETMRKIAEAPVAVWFGDWNGKDIEREVREMTKFIRGQRALPVYVAYNIPNRNCGLYSAGGAVDAEAYLRWIRSMAKGIGRRSAVVILEPDALSETACLDEDQAKQNMELLRKAVDILKAKPRTYVYIDAGNAEWIAAEEMAERLQTVGIHEADGFSLNVSNFLRDEENIAYGEKLSALLNEKHFIIDTSRNGRGPAPDYEWCNPRGRAIGRVPTTQTEHSLVDAYLWIKQPGESDGECNGGPPAGVWWAEYALELARNSR